MVYIGQRRYDLEPLYLLANAKGEHNCHCNKSSVIHIIFIAYLEGLLQAIEKCMFFISLSFFECMRAMNYRKLPTRPERGKVERYGL